jgi:hypothetical protein
MQNIQGNMLRGAPQRPRQEGGVKPRGEVVPQNETKPYGDPDKLPKMTCFNFAEWGHFSTDCKAPKLCFICQTTDHVGRNCPEWEKPLEFALYLGSAA